MFVFFVYYSILHYYCSIYTWIIISENSLCTVCPLTATANKLEKPWNWGPRDAGMEYQESFYGIPRNSMEYQKSCHCMLVVRGIIWWAYNTIYKKESENIMVEGKGNKYSTRMTTSFFFSLFISYLRIIELLEWSLQMDPKCMLVQ